MFRGAYNQFTGHCSRHLYHTDEFRDCHECHRNNHVVLPWEMLEAAHRGDVNTVKEYIAKDGNINGNYEGDTLLARACVDGQSEIVALLLQCPEIHLNHNNQNQGSSPLMLAAEGKHMDCMKLLIDSAVQCEIKFDSCWCGVTEFLKTKPDLRPRSIYRLLTFAGAAAQWDIVELILHTNHTFLQEDIHPFITKAADQDRWDIIKMALNKKFLGKNEILVDLLPVLVNSRDWDRVREILQFMSADLKLDIPLVEAALFGEVEEMQRILSDSQLDASILNGCLLIVAAGNTTAEVAEFLLNMKGIFTKRTFIDALFMSAQNNSTVMFPHLLSNAEVSYNFDQLHKINRMVNGHGHSRPDNFVSAYFNKLLTQHQDLLTGGLNIKQVDIAHK